MSKIFLSSRTLRKHNRFFPAKNLYSPSARHFRKAKNQAGMPSGCSASCRKTENIRNAYQFLIT